MVRVGDVSDLDRRSGFATRVRDARGMVVATFKTRGITRLLVLLLLIFVQNVQTVYANQQRSLTINSFRSFFLRQVDATPYQLMQYVNQLENRQRRTMILRCGRMQSGCNSFKLSGHLILNTSGHIEGTPFAEAGCPGHGDERIVPQAVV